MSQSFESFTPEETEILKKYVTSTTEDVFAITNLQGLTGAVYARYSRAPGGMRKTLLKEFLQEGNIDPKKADELIQRVLVAYGDDSVGELEGAHLSLESISNLATKEIQDRRIGGSPIEQSTRYVVYDQKDTYGRYRYVRPQEVIDAGILNEYEAGLNSIFDTYVGLIKPMEDYFRTRKPLEDAAYDLKGKGTKQKRADLTDDKERKAWDRTYKFDLRSKTCDTLRILLPAATGTNMGVFGNGRFYQNLISHLLTHPLAEMHMIANSAHESLSHQIPQYVRRAAKNEFIAKTRDTMWKLTDELLKDIKPESPTPASLFDEKHEEYMDNIAAQMLFAYSEHPLAQLKKLVKGWNKETKEKIFKTYMGERITRRDRPGRALEFGYPLHYELVADFGIYRDLQRHRMLTQERQLLTPYLGYEIPAELVQAKVDDQIKKAFDTSRDLYELIKRKTDRYAAQYAVLFGYNLRWVMGMNDRAAMHMWELRTTPQGHPRYRKVCQEMHRLLKEREPMRAEAMKFVDYGDYYWSRADSEAKQRQKEIKMGNEGFEN